MIDFLFHFQSSGVQVSQEVKDAYEEIKKGKKTPYAIFRIDETIVVLDKKGKEGIYKQIIVEKLYKNMFDT